MRWAYKTHSEVMNAANGRWRKRHREVINAKRRERYTAMGAAGTEWPTLHAVVLTLTGPEGRLEGRQITEQETRRAVRRQGRPAPGRLPRG